jgi:4-amino-4-deoxy-L-arabinose transferase-like glycosyltransferase
MHIEYNSINLKTIGIQMNLYKNPTQTAYFTILFVAVFSTIYNIFLPLHGDEAYYWVWSHNLQAGYFDHPPMIAFMISLTNFISQSEWGVRLVNIFCMSFTAIYIFKLTSLVADKKSALNSVFIFLSVLLTNAGFIMTTPDSPLSLFWAGSLYYSYKALFIGEKKDFLLSGLFIGLMILSKYTAILFIFSVLLFIVIRKRELFLNPYMYAAILIAIVISSPMVYWNYENDWISFAFQFQHGQDSQPDYSHIIDFVSGQFAIFSPVFTWILFYYLLKEKLYFKNDKLFFISINIAVVILFFLYKTPYVVLLNYTAPAYIGGAVLLAWIIKNYELKKSFKVGLLIALTLTIIARIVFLFFLPYVQERMYGNKEAVELVTKYAQKGDHFYSDHLTMAAYLEYYIPSHPKADVAIASRYSQYDMWRKKDYLQNGIYLGREKSDEERLKNLYKDVKLLDTLTVTKGINTTKTFYIYRVTDPRKEN